MVDIIQNAGCCLTEWRKCICECPVSTYVWNYLHMIQEGVTQINTDLLQQSNTYLDKPGQIENLSHTIPIDFQFRHQMRLKPIFILQNSLLELLNQDFYSCTNKIEEIIVCKWNQQVCHQQPWTKLVSYCSLLPPCSKRKRQLYVIGFTQQNILICSI